MATVVKQKQPCQFQCQPNKERAMLAKRKRTKFIGPDRRGLSIRLFKLLSHNRGQRKKQSFEAV